MSYMVPAAQEIQEQIDELEKKRDALRGNYITICGYCYYDIHPGRSCNPIGLQSLPLGIYDTEWQKDDDGRWSPK